MKINRSERRNHMNNQELLTYIELLREKIDTGKLIVFVGAGVSKNVNGIPDWNHLVRKMADSINYSRCDSCWHKTESCQENCAFQQDYSQDELLKIPQYVFNTNKDLYEKILRENIPEKNIDAPMSKAIFELNPAHIITTNFDKLLESSSHPARENYDVIIQDADLLKSNKKQYIIKMHGDIAPENIEKIVLKESDYLQFSQHHVLIELFVKALLADHTILFLGYSMNDYNIKLIISWLNHLRSQNKELLKENTRIGYIVQDNELINIRDIAYFAENYIGIINLHAMPLLNDIPQSITNDIGQRLYSFLSVLHNEKLEVLLGRELVFNNVVSSMKKYPFINFDTIARLLHLETYQFEYGEVTLHNYSDYTALISYLTSETNNAAVLSHFFHRAGVHKLTHHHGFPHKEENHLISSNFTEIKENDLLYQLYLHNRYIEINSSLEPMNSLQKLFYGTLTEGYTQHLLDSLSHIDSTSLSIPDRIAYLINQATCKAFHTWKFDKSAVVTCMDNVPSKQAQQIFKPIREMLSGNTALRMRINECFKKLEEEYDPHNCVIGSSLRQLNKLKVYAYDAYALFFAYHIFFENTADLRNLLLPYIDGMLLTNGKSSEIEITDYFFQMGSNRKQKYSLNTVDIDMLTKFPKAKELEEMLTKHQVSCLAIEADTHAILIELFINLTTSMLRLKAFKEHRIAKTFVNFCILLPLMKLTQEQKAQLSMFLDSLFVDQLFIENFFSINFYEWRLALKALHGLVCHVGIKKNICVLEAIIQLDKFDEYYINVNQYILGELLCLLVDKEIHQEALGTLLNKLSDARRIRALHLIRQSIIDETIKTENKTFLQEHIVALPDDILSTFVLNQWITLLPSDGQKLVSDVLSTVKEQPSGMHISPDPVAKKLENIYLFHITGCLADISGLKEISDHHPILQFLLDLPDFDYSLVDFEHYMWQNIARRKKYMQRFINHKAEIIPNLKQKVDLGIASDFEIKVLYGYLLGNDSIKLW